MSKKIKKLNKQTNVISSYTFKILCISMLCPLFLSTINVKAQVTLLDVAFAGDWFFNRAEIQEKQPSALHEFSISKTISLQEFTEKPIFQKIPTHIAFRESKFLTYTAGETWFLKVFAIINNNGELEFHDAMNAPMDYDDEEKGAKELNIESYPLEITFYNYALTENTMLLQCYYYNNDEDVEGVITIYYHKQQ